MCKSVDLCAHFQHEALKNVLRSTFYSRVERVSGDREKGGVRKGDYYARISIPGSSSTSRTRTLQNTGTPRFEKAEMAFNVYVGCILVRSK